MDVTSLPYRPCVGIMVLNRAGQVWIGRRHDAPGEPEGPGAWWQMPQGGIDESEDPAKAALRELTRRPASARSRSSPRARAGTPTTCRRSWRPKAWGGRYRGQKQKWFAMRFTGSDDEIALARPPGHRPSSTPGAGPTSTS